MLDWHSDKLFARSDSFVACVAERMLIVADFASSCSRRSDQLVTSGRSPRGHDLGLPIGPVPAAGPACSILTSSSRDAPPETSSASNGPTAGA